MATKVSNAYNVLMEVTVEGETWIELNCRDYDHYSSLPDVLSYSNRTFVKRGWNSDRNIVAYRSSNEFARKVG